MATLKTIRRRITSVNSTQQITRAMKLVSAAKLRRAQEALVNARPYAETLARVAGSLLDAERAALAPAEGAGAVALIVVVGSDRGLNGSCNANLMRTAEQTSRRLRVAGLAPEFFAVGRKTLDHFRRTRQTIAGERINNLRAWRRLAWRGSSRIGCWRSIAAGGSARRVSSTAASAPRSRSVPTYERILPIAEPEPLEGQERKQPPTRISDRAEPRPNWCRWCYAVMLSRDLPCVAGGRSQRAQRTHDRDGLRPPTTPCDMIATLTLEMNRARQATITTRTDGYRGRRGSASRLDTAALRVAGERINRLCMSINHE